MVLGRILPDAAEVTPLRKNDAGGMIVMIKFSAR